MNPNYNQNDDDENDDYKQESPRVVPCLMGASLRGIGVEALLDASVALLPNPKEKSPPFLIPPPNEQPVNGKASSESMKRKALQVESEDPLCALAFKVMNDSHRGALVYLRIYSGTLKKGQVLQCGGGQGSSSSQGSDGVKGNKERMTHLLKPFGDDLIPVGDEGAKPGDTVVAVGLKKTVTGDSVVAFKGPLHGWTLPRIPIPHPVFALSVSPVNSLKAKALEEALQIMSRDDPSLLVGPDPENTDEILMQGMGELHLDVACSRLKSEFGLDVKTGRMRIAYRETINNLPVTINKFKYDRLIGEAEKQKRLFVGYSVELTPIQSQKQKQNEEDGEDDGKYSMNSSTVSISTQARLDLGNLEKSEIVKKAFEDALLIGPRHGFPLIGFHLTVLSVETDHDTNPLSLIQGAEALLQHFSKKLKTSSSSSNNVELLHPIMALEVSTPEENMGNVLTDLTVGRNATIKSIDVIGSGINVRHIIKSDTPLSKLLGFSTDLRSLTSGEGLFSMEYSHHSVIDHLPEEDANLSSLA
eukprot:CAMPEP_0114338496 /NCGR_PEP_ID=MMETSP0101-20121206/7077_1 /TAXON_ID=38822 ORGANISM="Pteridomonas danica, Strain PT" /NCGR_SAMPLE_ID=MMETSP0101 /ASSEMBLY_ACC=CAM_ASM_000211 /LENGTH=529 /DNA_ID=CAMNT_0001471101 /DNA_START=66 /DNA_END=1655 /DNA_ORIENTATION=+